MSRKSLSLTFCLIFALLFCLYQLSSSSQKINPLSSKNDFHSQLNHALHLGEMDTGSIQIRNFYQEVEFHTNGCQVILSTQKDPYWQIASLQQLLKTAKIKDKQAALVDLTGSHPYATLKNR